MIPQISTLLSGIPINSFAVSTGFIKRDDYKIGPDSFVHSFFELMSTSSFSLHSWALNLSVHLKDTVSIQAIQGKLSFRHIAFTEQLLKYCINLRPRAALVKPPCFLDSFNNVLIGDSTCLALPKVLNDIFKGSYSKNGNAATARVQLLSNLKTDEIVHIEIGSFCDNDQAYSNQILKFATSGDLVIRDLGYSNPSVFKEMCKQGIFYISRLMPNMNLYSTNGALIDLNKLLRDSFRKGKKVVDISILLSKKYKLPVRLVAFKAPDKVIKQRLKKAKNDRNVKANHSEQYMDRLKYSIYVTNVQKTTLSAKQIYNAYKLRWRIEIIFKCWKSKLKLKQLFNNKIYHNPAVPINLLYLYLSMITLIHNHIISPLLNNSKSERNNRNGSILKIAHIVMSQWDKFCKMTEPFKSDYLKYYGSYQKHKWRKTHFDLLYTIN